MGILASAITVIERRSNGAHFETIIEMVKENEVGCIVAGLPRLMDGSFGTQAEKTRDFLEQLKLLTNVPIEMSDERLSTSVADQLMRDAGKNRKQIKEKRDAVAAALILQWYLDEHRDQKENSV